MQSRTAGDAAQGVLASQPFVFCATAPLMFRESMGLPAHRGAGCTDSTQANSGDPTWRMYMCQGVPRIMSVAPVTSPHSTTEVNSVPRCATHAPSTSQMRGSDVFSHRKNTSRVHLRGPGTTEKRTCRAHTHTVQQVSDRAHLTRR